MNKTQLLAAIAAINPEAKTSGLTNAQLEVLLEDLQNATKDAGTPDAGTPDAGTQDTGTQDTGTQDAGTQDEGTQDAGTPDLGAILNAPKVAKVYHVQLGKSITTLAGIKIAGDAVTFADFSGGDETIENLTKTGYIK